MNWEASLTGLEDGSNKGNAVVMPALRGSQFSQFLAVLSTEARPFDTYLTARPGRLAAVAIRNRKSNFWLTGVASFGSNTK
jgi:hypothetical protein